MKKTNEFSFFKNGSDQNKIQEIDKTSNFSSQFSMNHNFMTYSTKNTISKFGNSNKSKIKELKYNKSHSSKQLKNIDDYNLMKLVENHFPDWEIIGSKLNIDPEILKIRYNESLNPSLKRCKFSPSEDEKLIDLFKVYGCDWQKIANEFQNTRSSRMLKNRYYSHVRKVMKKNGLIKFSLNNLNKMNYENYNNLSENNQKKLNEIQNQIKIIERNQNENHKEKLINKIKEIEGLIDKTVINNLENYFFNYDKGDVINEEVKIKTYNINLEILKICNEIIIEKLKRREKTKLQSLDEISQSFLFQSEIYLKLIQMTKIKLEINSLPPIPM